MRAISKLFDSIKEKIDMYDELWAERVMAKNNVYTAEDNLDSSQIKIGYSTIESAAEIRKLFAIKLPMWVPPALINDIRRSALGKGIKINQYIYSEPFKINWNSNEMVNKLAIWRKYTEETKVSDSVFDYRTSVKEKEDQEKLKMSTLYFNKTEVDNNRTTVLTTIILEVVCDKNNITNMSRTIYKMYDFCNDRQIKLIPLDYNFMELMGEIGVFSIDGNKLKSLLPKALLTDDILANFHTYKQGKTGYDGIPIGMDVKSGQVVYWNPLENAEDAGNVLVGGMTGSGKSYIMKNILVNLSAFGLITVILDYEGDEYIKIVEEIKKGNPNDVSIISMGSSDGVYFEPMEIAELTGDHDTDQGLKDTAATYANNMFKQLVLGEDDVSYTIYDKRIITLAIKRVFESRGVTNDSSTWINSIGLRLSMVYDEIKKMEVTKEFEGINDNRHAAVMKLVDIFSMYFEDGELYCNAFSNPMSVNKLLGSKVILFRFGNKGAIASQSDKTILKLKQLSVANISNQISNHAKYVLGKYSLKIWEEFNRWGSIEGSSEIIINEMTGGRKRGVKNILATNNIANLLDEDNKVSQALMENFTTVLLGRIKSADIIEKICNKLERKELIEQLKLMSKIPKKSKSRNKSGRKVVSKYKYAFVFSDENDTTMLKVSLHPLILKKKIFNSTNIDNSNTGDSYGE